MQSTTAAVSLSNVAVANGEGAETQLSGVSHKVQINLDTLLTDAQTKHDAAVEGTQVGQYPAGEKASLQIRW